MTRYTTVCTECGESFRSRFRLIDALKAYRHARTHPTIRGHIDTHGTEGVIATVPVSDGGELTIIGEDAISYDDGGQTVVNVTSSHD